MTKSLAAAMHWIDVKAVSPAPGHGQGVAAFAIDSPRAGDHLPGRGLEINGWAIGQAGPLRGLRAVVNDLPGAAQPLAVYRPDVAADYPRFAHAAESGFSFWTALGTPGDWALTIEALLADGTPVTLAEVRGTGSWIDHQPPLGQRAVHGPDFAIIGAQRGGTTSLHAYLSSHPQVVSPATKELHYLTDRFHRGRDWYLGQFPREVPASVITGEATPYALFHPNAPDRLRDVAPAAKVIVLLRDPTERAWSHYQMERARGDEQLSFDQALAAEPERLAGEEARLLADPAYVSFAHNHFSYLARGHYAAQLARWLDAFPREQVLILRSEDFYQQTARVFSQVTSFLGIAPAPDTSFAPYNRGAGPPLDAGRRERLACHFAPLNAELGALLGWDPEWN